MSKLGWKILEQGSYRIPMPLLSAEEEDIIEEIGELFREETRVREINDEASARGRIREILEFYIEDNNLSLDKMQREYLVETCLLHVWSYGPLDFLLEDESLEEIAIIGKNKPVYVYKRKRGWLSTNLVFTNDSTLVNLINKMARSIGRRITLQNPRLNAILPDGSRLHASIPPVSQLELTIRKFRKEPFSPIDLIRFNTISPEALAFLWLLMKVDLSIVIAGNTASGKTTTLNSLFSFVPMKERILITEETPEISIPHEHIVNLVSSDEIGVGMKELIGDSLRMRPDRVIVGEVRTKNEAQAFVETVLSGQARGSYATFHAQSTEEAISRLRNFDIMPVDLKSIDLIVVQRRMMKYEGGKGGGQEMRRILELSELKKDWGNQEVEFIKLFEYDPKQDRLRRMKSYAESALVSRVCNAYGITLSEFEEEILARKQFLESMIDADLSFKEVVGRIQKWEQEEKRAERVRTNVNWWGRNYELDEEKRDAHP